MRNRRVTLIVLVILTILAGLDIKFGFSRNGGAGQINFKVKINERDIYPSQAITQTLTFSAADLSEFIVVNNGGNIDISGVDTDQITISAKITVKADTEELAYAYAEQLEVELEQAEGKAKLVFPQPERPTQIKEVRVDYTIRVPEDLNMVVKGNQCQIDLADLQGFVEIIASFGSINTRHLTGFIDGNFQYSSVLFQRFGGSLKTKNSFSNMILDLDKESIGFTFDVDLSFGNLLGAVVLQQETGMNTLKGTGQIGDGQNSVVVDASFGNVEIN